MATWTPSQSGANVSADFSNTESMGFQIIATNPVIGSGVTKVQFRLFSPGTPSTYLISAKIYDSTGTLKETSTTTVQANTIGSTALYTWDFAGTHTISANDYISIEPGDGTSVKMAMSDTSSDPYRACRQTIGGAVGVFSPARYPDDVEVTYGSPTPPPSSSSLLLPPQVAWI